MSLEVRDLAGLSQPVTKLIEVVSSAVGTLYRPRGIRVEADARAYELKAIARAKIESEEETKTIQLFEAQKRIFSLAEQYPELAERARLRLLTREIEGQINVESIAEHAELALPEYVSDEPVSADWRRKFFQEAENVCEVDMQSLWGKILAGEISKPGSFGLRTLETLKQLSSQEAELFRSLCSLAMDEGIVAMPGNDINTALKPFGFGYSEILRLRDSGLLLHGDNLHYSFPIKLESVQPENHKALFTNNGVLIELSGVGLSSLNIPALIFTQAGRELQRLIEKAPNEIYLSKLAPSLRMFGVQVKRGTLVPQDEKYSIVVFEDDL